MPELSRFGGMVIYMLFYDIGQHNKPHVHVYYGDYEAAIAIDGELLAGSLPRKQLKIITGWLAFHEEEAYKAWNLAVKESPHNVNGTLTAEFQSPAACKSLDYPPGNLRDLQFAFD